MQNSGLHIRLFENAGISSQWLIRHEEKRVSLGSSTINSGHIPFLLKTILADPELGAAAVVKLMSEIHSSRANARGFSSQDDAFNRGRIGAQRAFSHFFEEQLGDKEWVAQNMTSSADSLEILMGMLSGTQAGGTDKPITDFYGHKGTEVVTQAIANIIAAAPDLDLAAIEPDDFNTVRDVIKNLQALRVMRTDWHQEYYAVLDGMIHDRKASGQSISKYAPSAPAFLARISKQTANEHRNNTLIADAFIDIAAAKPWLAPVLKGQDMKWADVKAARAATVKTQPARPVPGVVQAAEYVT